MGINHFNSGERRRNHCATCIVGSAKRYVQGGVRLSATYKRIFVLQAVDLVIPTRCEHAAGIIYLETALDVGPAGQRKRSRRSRGRGLVVHNHVSRNFLATGKDEIKRLGTFSGCVSLNLDDNSLLPVRV